MKSKRKRKYMHNQEIVGIHEKIIAYSYFGVITVGRFGLIVIVAHI